MMNRKGKCFDQAYEGGGSENEKWGFQRFNKNRIRERDNKIEKEGGGLKDICVYEGGEGQIYPF